MVHGRIDEDLKIFVPITLVADPDIKIEALRDTGFNGEFVLSKEYAPYLELIHVCEIESELADGRIIEDDLFTMAVRFNGETKLTLASLTESAESLVETQLLQEKQLRINFVSGEVMIEQAL